MNIKDRKFIKFLIFGIVVFLINFIKLDNCESVYADIKTGTVCAPVTVRICSICGNDYDNPEVCPHHIGEQYNGNICSPTSGRICSICGGDYEDGSICPHHEGEEYGGEVCSPVRICDICGGNYDDGNECPHHEGEEYGGEVCTVETVTICNICGNDYHDGSLCTHLRDNYYDDEWCEPEDIRICSICGNNYDDGNECPHHEGEVYNEQVCTITRVCNICGGNYDDGSECPHHEGDTYGSTECTVSEGRLCNICGHNYDDGRVCPHKSGQMYDGDVCEANEVRFCNICGNNYDDPSVCPHKVGTFYEDIAYFIYLAEWVNEAQLEQQRLARYYNITEDHVITIEVSNLTEFENAWNGLGEINGKYYNIAGVVIDTHGSYSSLMNDKGWVLATCYTVKTELKDKKMKKLVLLGCDVGNIEKSTNNIAVEFAKKVEGALVVASDGTVNDGKRDFSLGFVPFRYVSDGLGWYVYTYNSGKLIVSESKGTSLTIEQMLALSM